MIKRLPARANFVTVPATALVVGLGTRGLGLGTAGIVGGAALGLAWSIALGVVVDRLIRRDVWHRRLADGSVFLGILATGTMFGGGVMYGLLMKAATAAPAPVLTALMQATIPFFIVLNTPLELLVVPGAVLTNWQNYPRRWLILIAASGFYAMRIWSYIVYVPNRMEIAARPLSPEDVEWFQRSMDVDYRVVLTAAVLTALTAAAFVRDSPDVPSGVRTASSRT